MGCVCVGTLIFWTFGHPVFGEIKGDNDGVGAGQKLIANILFFTIDLWTNNFFLLWEAKFSLFRTTLWLMVDPKLYAYDHKFNWIFDSRKEAS